MQTALHSWPREVEPWCHVHMDHAYITEVGLLLKLVDTFSDWPKVIYVPDKKSSIIKQILRVIFSRNGIPKTLVSNNAPEPCDEDLELIVNTLGGARGVMVIIVRNGHGNTSSNPGRS